MKNIMIGVLFVGLCACGVSAPTGTGPDMITCDDQCLKLCKTDCNGDSACDKVCKEECGC